MKPWENSGLRGCPSAGSLEVRRIVPGSCIGSSRKPLKLNRLLDSALHPSHRFARSVRKAFIVHEESSSYRGQIRIHCKSIPNKLSKFRGIFGGISPTEHRQNPRNPAIYREIPPMQNNLITHSYCICWNSVAVMFELRCSGFELRCSGIGR